jgi:hypothetical protein
MNDLTPTAFFGANIQQIGIQHLMAQSLQVFRFSEEFEDAFDLIQAHAVTKLVNVEDRQFTALKQAKTRQDRFQVHCDAHQTFEQLPPIETLVAASKSVKSEMALRPSEFDLNLLVGKVLDFWMINSDTAAEYGSGLAWKLSECPRQPGEKLFHRRKTWLAVPAIAGAFNVLLDTYRPNYGKPPHLPDVLEECGRQSDRLIQLHDNIEKLGQTHCKLKKLIEFTNDSYPDDDDDWGVPDDDD